MGIKRFPLIKYSPHLTLIKLLFKYYNSRLSKIVFISEFASRKFQAQNQKLSEKVLTIINGIDDIHYKLRKKEWSKDIINLITVGTVSNRKGQDILIKSISKLSNINKQKIHLTIVGGGPQIEEFKSLAEDLELKTNVSFLGRVDSNSIPSLLQESSAFVLISNSEGLPLSNIEALRCGLPIITSNVDGCPETVNGKNGFSISPNANDLTIVLEKLFTVDLIEMGKESRSLFEEKFHFDFFSKKYIEMIKSEI
jgi:glycosyltransferase involved in cell wall biosynthesis